MTTALIDLFALPETSQSSATTGVHLTEQETKLLKFLSNKEIAYWEELAQFSKSPTTVKLKTIRKSVSELRRKFTSAHLPVPFSCQFQSMATTANGNKRTPSASPNKETMIFNGQTLVKIKSSASPPRPSLALVSAEAVMPKITPKSDPNLFQVNHIAREVLTRSGKYRPNIEDFEILEYLFQQKRFVSLEELRDKVVYPNFGSKTPTRWFNSIQSRVNNIRRQIPEAKNRILTVRCDMMTGYLFQ
jgi:hypothetical protein